MKISKREGRKRKKKRINEREKVKVRKKRIRKKSGQSEN